MGVDCTLKSPQIGRRNGVAGSQGRHTVDGELPDGRCPVCAQAGIVFLCEECGTRLIQESETLWVCPRCVPQN